MMLTPGSPLCTHTVGSVWMPRQCAHVLPCPLHGKEQARLSDEDFEAHRREWMPWEQRCSIPDFSARSAVQGEPNSDPAAPSVPPMPRLFGAD